VWDVKSGKSLHILIGHLSDISSVAFSPDGNYLASGSGDKTVRLWDLNNGKLRFTLTGHSSSVESIAYSPKGNQLASGSSDNTLRLWDLCNNEKILILKGHTSTVWNVAYSPDGNRLASGSNEGIFIWQKEENKIIIQKDERWILRYRLSCSGALCSEGSYLKDASISPANLKLLRQLGAHCDEDEISHSKNPIQNLVRKKENSIFQYKVGVL